MAQAPPPVVFGKVFFSKAFFGKVFFSKTFFSKVFFSKTFFSKVFFGKTFFAKAFFAKVVPDPPPSASLLQHDNMNVAGGHPSVFFVSKNVVPFVNS